MARGVQSRHFVGAAGFLPPQEVDHLVGVFEIFHLFFDLRAKTLHTVVGVIELLFKAGCIQIGPLQRCPFFPYFGKLLFGLLVVLPEGFEFIDFSPQPLFGLLGM